MTALNIENTDTESAELAQKLPVPVGAARPRPSLARYTLPASFASQLIASHRKMPTQRARRRVPSSIAQNAYRHTLNVAVNRLPPGYRLTETV